MVNMSQDEKMMQRCIELAKQALDAGDHPFGSVITDAEGRLVAEGRNRECSEHDPSWHAEMEAVRNATRSMQVTAIPGTTLYASGEPCLMCATVIRRAGISRVVVGARTTNPIAVEPHPLTAPEFAETPVPELLFGVLEEAAMAVQGRTQGPE